MEHVISKERRNKNKEEDGKHTQLAYSFESHDLETTVFVVLQVWYFINNKGLYII